MSNGHERECEQAKDTTKGCTTSSRKSARVDPLHSLELMVCLDWLLRPFGQISGVEKAQRREHGSVQHRGATLSPQLPRAVMVKKVDPKVKDPGGCCHIRVK